MTQSIQHYVERLGYMTRAEWKAWAYWYDTADRSVVDEMLGDVRISTYAQGMDERELYSTLIQGGPYDDCRFNHSHPARSEAIEAHSRIMEALRNGEDPTRIDFRNQFAPQRH
jgi:hypothetical protein